MSRWFVIILVMIWNSSLAEATLSVVATTSQIGDVVKNVAHESVQLVTLMGPGVDPHLYQPTRSDVVHLTRADIVFYNGIHLEGQMGPMLERLSHQKIIIAVAEQLNQTELLLDQTDSLRFDPHIWMNVLAWQKIVSVVSDVLCTTDQAHCAAYQANAEAYRDALSHLDDYVRRSLATVPDHARVLITAHDAFQYFGTAYGFEVMGIQGLSTESEPGLRRIETLVNLLVERRIAAVFVETSVSSRNVRALIEGAARRNHTVTIGGALFSDAMGPESTYEGTYIGMIDHNITVITRALGGIVPSRGMSGQLSHPISLE